MSEAVYRVSVIVMLIFVFFPCDASAQIAPGVTQSAARTANIAGTVTQSNGTPVQGAEVRLNGPTAQLMTQSNDKGVFNFISVPWGIYRITVTSALGTASRSNVTVNGDVTVVIAYQAQAGLQTIAHVSVGSAGASINVTPASITSITPSDYAFQGNASWQQLLNQIPGVTVGGYLDGGYTTQVTIPGNPFQPIVLSINGALPYETSVTLDGMPLENISFANEGASPGGGTDLSFLPMPMFETADVVRGPGANAPSIVDSIGGSFVLHVPSSVSTDQFEFSSSNDPYGGIVANAKVALRFGRLSAVIVYGVNNSPGPLGNRNVTNAETFLPLTVGGEPFSDCAAPGCGNFVQNPNYQPCYCAFQNSLLIDGVPVSTAWVSHNGAFTLAYAVTPSINAQVFYAGSSSVMQVPYQEYPVDFTPAAGYSGSISPGQHDYVLSEGGISPTTQAESLLEEKVTANLGHGVLRLAALQSNSFFKDPFPVLMPNGQYTIYGTGYYTSAPTTPVNFNGKSEYLTFCQFMDSYTEWSNNRDLLGSYAVQVGSGSSVGMSYVTSYYNYPYEQDLVIGPPVNFSLLRTRSTAVSETTNEVRFNASTDVSDKLSFDASWYFALGSYHVTNPANPNTWANSNFPYNAPRFGAVWRTNTDSAIRVALGGGYALPPLDDLVGSSPLPTCSAGICSVTLTNLNLKPEQSFGLDIGTDIRFHRDTVLSFDVYRTNLYGQFFTTTTTGTYLGLPLYTTQYNNLQQSRYEGVNLDIRHDVPHGIYWHGALGLTRSYVVSVPTGFYNGISSNTGLPCVNCLNTYIIPGANFNGVDEAGISSIPYATGTAQLGYRWSAGRYVDVAPTYYGNGNPYFEPAFIELDAHAGYTLTKNISLLAMFRNITGIHDQSYQLLTPSLAAPTTVGLPYPLFGIPYGPRTVIVTIQVKG